LLMDGRNGFLVRQGDPAVFSEKIAKILADENTLKQFAEAARLSGLAYSLDAARHKWERVFASLMHQPFPE